MPHNSKLAIAIDGNEANVLSRVGSNVYAYEVLMALEQLTKLDQDISVVVLLRTQPSLDLPTARPGWQYRVIGPSPYWTQWALPIHLWLHHKEYQVFFTPGHYAPRLSAVPYVSSVMDLAFLKYPEQFYRHDYLQLKHWTSYSVKHARKIIAISEATKHDVIEQYRRSADDIAVAYPAANTIQTENSDSAMVEHFFRKHRIRAPYFMFLGTFQPRKNLINLVEAYEQLCRKLSSGQTKKRSRSAKRPKAELPQLILAGKIGWLAEPIIDRIKKSPFFDYIILPGFVPNELKPALYQRATASVLVGLHEGFGIPPLESMTHGCIPIVSNTTSLPEVVGEAGILVDPMDTSSISSGLELSLSLTAKQRALYRRKGREQLKKFSWEKSAQTILDTLRSVAIHKI